MNIKKLYKKYVNWIVIILFCLLCLKDCKSCSMQKSYTHQKQQYEYVIDSLKHINNMKSDTIKSQKDSINIYLFQLGIVSDNNEMLKEVNRHFQDANSVLVNTNRKLSNKKNHKDEEFK